MSKQSVRHNYETCPYNELPSSSWWHRAIASAEPGDFRPTLPSRFIIRPEDRIATAGSCFAQNLSRALADGGFNFHCVESGPAWLDATEKRRYNYGTFSARYGNIYTPAQLHQLAKRAVGYFHPAEPEWSSQNSRFFDPFRPQVQPDGFSSLEELLADRTAHLGAVRNLFETSDVFVFTLGLTEAWRSKIDHAVFPVAPGCGAGLFDPGRHEFHNFSVIETIAELSKAIELICHLNPKLRIVLTVSPVPLIATMEDRDVLQSTVYSKSVLRVAAEEMISRYGNVIYFPAYEIITALGNASRYFGEDRRSVTEEGVSHVMHCFFEVLTSGKPAVPQDNRPSEEASKLGPLICDEEVLALAMAAKKGI
jgi:hypothetical protein